MFTKFQVLKYPSFHFKAADWYLDCANGFVPTTKKALHKSVIETALVEMIDLKKLELETKTHSRIDLLFADVLENLAMPIVSNIVVPEWNQQPPYYLKNLFSFADASLHDNAILLLIHPNNLVLTKDIYGWAFTFDCYLTKDWWGWSELHLSSPTNPTELV